MILLLLHLLILLSLLSFFLRLVDLHKLHRGQILEIFKDAGINVKHCLDRHIVIVCFARLDINLLDTTHFYPQSPATTPTTPTAPAAATTTIVGLAEEITPIR